MTPAIEITRFNLAEGFTFSDFVAANADVDAWLTRQPGSRTRMIAQDDDGVVIDMVIFHAAGQARQSAERLMVELADSPVHAAIDQSTVSWTVASVGHQISS